MGEWELSGIVCVVVLLIVGGLHLRDAMNAVHKWPWDQ